MKRPPIVVVMGHVDHGKTTLLDYIRKTTVASREAGGITQSIGAYEIEHSGKKITFIDTPGHEAFFKMRTHGARVADLAILVVAADEGVKPQTKEALKAILEEKAPYIVAINKIDRPNADIEKTKHDLAESGIFLEGFGGDISFQAISAKTGEGVSELLDLLSLVSEVENPDFDPKAPASGLILTSRLDARKGIVAGVVITDGTLRVGDGIFSPSAKGKVRFLENSLGEKAEELQPSAPAVILGFEEAPEPGEEFSSDSGKIVPIVKAPGVQKSAEELLAHSKAIKLIIKASEAGSLSALEHILQKFESKHPMAIIEKGIGTIHENDIKLASATKAIVLGFRVKIDKAADNLVKTNQVVFMESEIIYEIEKKLEEYFTGHTTLPERILEILAAFGKQKGTKQVVGGRVTAGSVKNHEIFVLREGENDLPGGRILNLQSGKVDVQEVKEGSEAGLLVECATPIKPGMKLIFK